MKSGTFSRLLAAAKVEADEGYQKIKLQKPLKHDKYEDKHVIWTPSSSSIGRGIVDSKGSIIHQAIDYWEKYYMNDDENIKELFEFEIRNWSKFNPDAEEYTFEHTQLHQQYCKLFEEKFSHFLDERGIIPTEFYCCVNQQMNDIHNDEMKLESLKFLQVIQKVTDFELWAYEMRKAAKDKKNLEGCD